MTHTIYYDDQCSFCIMCVNFVRKNASQNLFEYQPLPEKGNTLILVEGEKRWNRSQAVFRILDLIGGKWKWISWMYHLPSWLIDPPYRLIAYLRGCK